MGYHLGVLAFVFEHQPKSYDFDQFADGIGKYRPHPEDAGRGVLWI